MKATIAILFACLTLGAHASTTLGITNGSTTGAVWQILDNSGTPVGATGQVLVGTFASTAGLDTAAAGDVLGGAFGWIQAGTQPFSTNAALPGVFGFAGTPTGSVDLPNEGSPAGDFVGKPIYAVITDGADTAIIDLGANFAFEDPNFDVGIPINPNIVNLGTGAILRGIFDPAGRDETALPFAADGTASLTLGAIPEPSSLLLLGLGGLGFVVRRKR